MGMNMHKKGDSNLTNLLFGLLVTLMVVGVVVAILSNVSTGLKKFVKLNFNCFSQDTDEDGTRDVAEDWIGMGDGCPCEKVDQGIADRLTPFSGSKHKCTKSTKDCETERYDKCIMGEKGTEVCSVPGRPPSDACEEEKQFGQACDILTSDGKPDPSFAGFKGVCNRAAQCVPPCEFCPCFATQAPVLCQDPRITSQYRCLKDEVKNQGVSCSAQSGSCQSGYSCCNAEELKEKEREQKAEQSSQRYKACLRGLSEEENKLLETEMKKPGGYDQNNPALMQILSKLKKTQDLTLNDMWDCLRHAAQECLSGAQGAKICYDLYFGMTDILQKDPGHRIQFHKKSQNSVTVVLSNVNDPLKDNLASFELLQPTTLCFGWEGSLLSSKKRVCKQTDFDVLLQAKSGGTPIGYAGNPPTGLLDIYSYPLGENSRRLCFIYNTAPGGFQCNPGYEEYVENLFWLN